jgi:hypothetical protein
VDGMVYLNNFTGIYRSPKNTPGWEFQLKQIISVLI